MEALAQAVQWWNTAVPTLPVTPDPALLWIALPLALVAVVVLGALTCARRAHRIGIAAHPAPPSRRAIPAVTSQPPVRPPVPTAVGPRGPTRPRAVAA